MKKFLICLVLIVLSVNMVHAQSVDPCGHPVKILGSAPLAGGQVAFSSPIVDDDGYMDGHIVVFDPQTGNIRWVSDTKAGDFPLDPLLPSNSHHAFAFNAQGTDSEGQILRIVYADASLPVRNHHFLGSIHRYVWTPDDMGLVVAHMQDGEYGYDGSINYTLLDLADGSQKQLLKVDLTGQEDYRLANSYSVAGINKARNSLIYIVEDPGIVHVNEISLSTDEHSLLYDIPLLDEYRPGSFQVSPDGSIISWQYSLMDDLVSDTNIMFYSTITNRVTVFPDFDTFGGEWLSDTSIFGTFVLKDGLAVFMTIDFSEPQPGVTQHPVGFSDYFDMKFNWIDNETIQLLDGSTVPEVSVFNINIETAEVEDLLEGVCLPKVKG